MGIVSPSKGEDAMTINLETMTIDEVRGLVDAEIARRKGEAIAATADAAARHGFTLRELFGRRCKANPVSNLPYGGATRLAVDMLMAGHHVNEITQALGYKNTGAVYKLARYRGIRIVNGRAVL